MTWLIDGRGIGKKGEKARTKINVVYGQIGLKSYHFSANNFHNSICSCFDNFICDASEVLTNATAVMQVIFFVSINFLILTNPSTVNH